MRILLVDDDELLAQTLATDLTLQRYAVDIAADGEQGWNYAQETTYDLIVLDINLPKLDGIHLCQKLRRQNYMSPILLLTSKGESSDKVIGLDAGADDYVVKPCTIAELTARIRALLRRPTTAGMPILEWGELRLDPSTCEVTCQEQPLLLSPKEYSLLELFLRNPQRVFSTSLILENLWGFDEPPGEETVRSHIKRLRHKLRSAGVGDAIENIYGMGYRLKPRTEPSPPIALAPPPTLDAPDVMIADQARAAAISTWEQFKTSMLERVGILEQCVASLERGTLSNDLKQQAEQVAHKLGGSLGMFGFPEGSQLGKEIEQLLTRELVSSDRIQLQPLVAQLRQVLQQPPSSPSMFNAVSSDAAAIAEGTTNWIDGIPRLLVVDDDVELTDRLQTEALNIGIQVEVVRTIPQARDRISQQLPTAVLLDFIVSGDPQDGLILLEELTEKNPNLPVFIFTLRDGFSDRLQVVRHGKHLFISKTLSPLRALEIVHDILQSNRRTEIRVLAVDDDPFVLNALQQLLPRWGIRLVTLSDPLQLWETLETIVPELLILDIEMPYINGIEICQVIRSDSTWNSLPILCLSGQKDAEIIRRFYGAGADDYIAKPFTELDVVTRILNRVERNRLLQNITETDPLTGITNRHQSTKQLNRYLGLCQRYQQPMCLAIVDLDRFKQINDQYGHDIGDLVLKRIANILRHWFRSGDVVARWSGEEFLIGIYQMKKHQVMERLSQLLEVVRREEFLTPSGELLHVTLSAGIAEAPGDGMDLSSLYRLADTALDQAKASGRDRIVLASAIAQ